MRMAGGTGALVRRIASSLPPESLHPDSRLTQLFLRDDAVDALFMGANGAEETLRASRVILAAPPRLLAATVSFSPDLEPSTASRWRATPTWMAPHAKFFALYDRPFWRDAGLSGTAQSMVGPLVEIHDATTAGGEAALFGFVGIPAAQRRMIGREVIIAESVRQLVVLFGAEAGAPRATLFKDWAADTLTATEADWTDSAHSVVDGRPWVDGGWRDRLILAGSETSPTEPGYLAGAVDAAKRAADEVRSWI